MAACCRPGCRTTGSQRRSSCRCARGNAARPPWAARRGSGCTWSCGRGGPSSTRAPARCVAHGAAAPAGAAGYAPAAAATPPMAPGTAGPAPASWAGEGVAPACSKHVRPPLAPASRRCLCAARGRPAALATAAVDGSCGTGSAACCGEFLLRLLLGRLPCASNPTSGHPMSAIRRPLHAVAHQDKIKRYSLCPPEGYFVSSGNHTKTSNPSLASRGRDEGLAPTAAACTCPTCRTCRRATHD